MMRRNIILASIIMIVIAAVAAQGAKSSRKPFLASSVTTVDQLTSQVIDNATVAARYAKHYKMSRNTVVDYFQANLRIGRLTRDYETIVYSIRERTDIASEKRTLPAGSYVFVTINGTPVLEGRTGNPLGDSLPVVVPTDTAPPSSLTGVDAESGSTSAIPNDGVVSKVLGARPAELAAVSTAITGVEPAVELVSAMPVSAAPSAAIGSSLRSILPIAAALGGAAAAAGGGGGDDAKSSAPASVPEPGSLFALAVGVSSVVLPRFRRRR